MAPKFNIIYEKKTLLPGEVVRGYVEVSTEKDIYVNALNLTAFGASKVEWDRYDHSQHRNVIRTDNEDYYEMQLKLWGDGSRAQLMPVGTHKHKFEFILPTGIPATFESKYGYVRHGCTVSMDIKDKVFDAKDTVYFSVSSDLDLNQIPEAKQPIAFQKEKSVTRLFSKGGKISFAMKVDHRGFVPGENVAVSAECANNSDKPTQATRLKLKQEVKYKTFFTDKADTNTVLCMERGETKVGERDVWSGELMKIPYLPPTGLPGCNLIDVNYFLKFEFIPSGLSFTLEESTWVLIGGIPLRDKYEGSRPSSPPAATSFSKQHYPDLPPSYEESIRK